MEMIGAASLLRMMPDGYEEACYSTGAIVRKREIKNPNDLMLLSLFHLLTGCSLIEVSEIARLAKLGNVSDVAFMKRFSSCNDWFKWILSKIQNDTDGFIKYNVPPQLSGYRILAVDASDVAEKGRSGRFYRLHFALDIARMHAAIYKITDISVGEHLRNFAFAPNDLVIADRMYSSVTGIEYCRKCGCQYIARMRTNSFKPYDSDGKQLDLLSIMKKKKCGELYAFARKERGENAGELIPVRICFRKKTPEAVVLTRKRMKHKESDKQVKFLASTYKFNEYIVLVTSLDQSITAENIIGLYRYRWQVELYFKRLKSIIGYGELPKKVEKNIFAWLNGKLMVALLIECLTSKVSFSPGAIGDEEHLAGDEDDDVAFVGEHY